MLPEEPGLRWPPEELDPVNAQIATWAAWYSGDLDQLAHAYADANPPQLNSGIWQSVRGFVRAIVRRWFHTPPPSNRPRQRVHLPLAGDIAAASAGLLFSEPPSVTAPETETAEEPVEGEEPKEPKADPVQERLDELIDDGVHATLLEAAEICSALGGVYLRIRWDTDTADKPWLAAVHPDAAVPEWQSGKLKAVTVWQVIHASGSRIVRHLERHEKGKILHGLYDGSPSELGHLIPLTDFPETAGLAEGLVNGNEIPTGTDQLTCRYIPNLKPNRIWRHLPVAANLGVADISGLESMLDMLDMTYSSWARAVEQGKPRLIVPKQYLTSLGVGEGASVDLDTEVYEGVSTLDKGEGLSVEQVQFEIPVEQYQGTIDQVKKDITASAGYSGRSFGLDEGAKQATATEVNSLDRKDSITRNRKICYWRPELADLIEALTAVDASVFPEAGGVMVRPVIEWPDAVSVDPLQQAQTLLALDGAKAVSTDTKVRMLHPDWTEPQIAKEVALIDAAAEPPDEFIEGGSFSAGDAEQPGDEPPTEAPPADPKGE